MPIGDYEIKCQITSGMKNVAIVGMKFRKILIALKPFGKQVFPSKKGNSACQDRGGTYNNNNELYLHDQTNTYSIAKAMFRNQYYNTGQLRYFDNYLSRTSKQAEIYFMNCILIK